MHSPAPSRRWPRYPVDLPVTVVVHNHTLATRISGRGTELSRGGMALYAGVNLNPGDLMQVEFPTPRPLRVKAMVRNRSGFCFGVEFVSVDGQNSAAGIRPNIATSLASGKPGAAEVRDTRSVAPAAVRAALRRKKQEMKRVEKEIQALRCAIPLLAVDDLGQ